ncbi:MAG: hypothetical protein AB7F40_00750 [Victivallaceae bacterium]
MKILKSQLADALKALGKVSDQIRIAGRDNVAVLGACNGVEQVTISLDTECPEPFVAIVTLLALKQALASGTKGTVELKVERDEVGLYSVCRGGSRRVGMRNLDEPWPELEEVPDTAACVELPDSFMSAMAHVATAVDRNESRKYLRGINLSCHGITATDGKQLLHVPMLNDLAHDLILPFPYSLLMAKPQGISKISVWKQAAVTMFCLEVGCFEWYAPAVDGNFPAWKHIIPRQETLDSSITFNDTKAVIDFLNDIPNRGQVNAVELCASDHMVVMSSTAFPELEIETPAGIIGKPSLAMNKPILLRMLKLGYNTLKSNSHDFTPVLAEGGIGVYVAMPVRVMKKLNQVTESVNKEIYKMEDAKKIETEPLDELNAGIEELRQNLKTLFDASAQLSRKLKEATLAQKQKEREYVQARRAIERIRAAV